MELQEVPKNFVKYLRKNSITGPNSIRFLQTKLNAPLSPLRPCKSKFGIEFLVFFGNLVNWSNLSWQEYFKIICCRRAGENIKIAQRTFCKKKKFKRLKRRTSYSHINKSKIQYVARRYEYFTTSTCTRAKLKKLRQKSCGRQSI